MKLSTAEINASMVNALQGVNQVMEKVNGEMDIHHIQQILKEFAKNSEKMEMQQEMMSDAIDAGMDNGEDVENAEKIYSQICEEIGIEVSEENDVKLGKINHASAPAVIEFLCLILIFRKLKRMIFRQDLTCSNVELRT